MFKPISPASDREGQQKIGPGVIIEGVLDLALIAGFLAAIGLLITVTIRLVFSL
jgi:hypothetical protein